MTRSVRAPRPPLVSVVVSTRNRSARLSACLDSIRAAALKAGVPVEAVIVDNGSTDDTREVLRAWAAAASHLAVTPLFEPRPGTSHARNTGIAAARGQIVVFTDDDCRLAPDFISTAVKLVRTGPPRSLFGGRVLLGDPADLPFTIRLEEKTDQLLGDTHPGGFLLGCNMVASREALDRIGPFDPLFGPGASTRAAEDTDFIYRAAIAGLPVLYVPSLVVFHHHGRRDPRDLARLYEGYNIGNGALYAKHMWKHPRLLKHFLWDVRDGVFELFGGPSFNPALGLSYRGKALGNLVGAARYLRLRAATLTPRSRRRAGRRYLPAA